MMGEGRKYGFFLLRVTRECYASGKTVNRLETLKFRIIGKVGTIEMPSTGGWMGCTL